MSDSSFRLIIRKGPNPGLVFDLAKEVSLIGRDVTNDIVIGDPEISRQHARLTRTPGGFVLEDLGSTNGSFVNSERLMAPRVLNPGDIVGFGENVTLIFDATAPEAAATVARPADEPVAAAPPPAPKVQAPVAAPPAAQPVAQPVAAAPASGDTKGRGRWVMAGIGCLAIGIACIAIFALMDALYPDLLYAPLRLFGF